MPPAAAAQAAVAESLHLLRFPPDASEEDVSRVVDAIWSLQYAAAGPICASAGPLPAALARMPPPAAACSHAVLFRYGTEAALQRFQAQPRVRLMLSGADAPQGTAITTLNFLGAVPNELEAVFRRGGQWEAGLELVLALAVQEGSEAGDASEFLSLSRQLAVSPAFGAVQCSYGRCLSVVRHGSGGNGGGGEEGGPGSAELAAPDMLLLARFEGEEQLRQFLCCPPLAALLEGDERLGLRALWSCALATVPSDSSSSRPVQGGLV
ncbi:hypothetical protein D9Q98_010621 [Chlorella vulgaris]|uniref:Uncharacterized protein n=1 Tax=Chlorella vulgaris TaxID=3077 RepID=A0A9D4TEI1_CHLVU|nr:hypothetical protein D9Q98_010621 [Chlorella vulgaris]